MQLQKTLRGMNDDDYYRMAVDFGGLRAEEEEEGAEAC
jgi:hypothetical protein